MQLPLSGVTMCITMITTLRPHEGMRPNPQRGPAPPARTLPPRRRPPPGWAACREDRAMRQRRSDDATVSAVGGMTPELREFLAHGWHAVDRELFGADVDWTSHP